MKIRRAALEDVEGIVMLHTRSVRGLCAEDYSPEQIKVWTGKKDLEKYRVRIKRDPTFVAEHDGKIVGYVRIFISGGEFASLFVDPDFARQGLGTALFDRALESAKAHGITHLWLDASLTAVPFYEQQGFQKDHDRMHDMGGVLLECVRMNLQIEK